MVTVFRNWKDGISPTCVMARYMWNVLRGTMTSNGYVKAGEPNSCHEVHCIHSIMRRGRNNCDRSILFIFTSNVFVILYTGASTNKPENDLASKLKQMKQLIIWNRFFLQKLNAV
jgi:hypothetical protein